ncbi:hypothetical protein N0V82_009198 [Gnomoniopsis sp. IMI 355080]|nr:hypothetical protein N0V82_009198 [Gnomoniopsis sp. IMI 355080]
MDQPPSPSATGPSAIPAVKRTSNKIPAHTRPNPMVQPPPPSAKEAEKDEAALSSSSTWPEDHAPHGVLEERHTILAGLPNGSVAQNIAVPVPRLAHDFRLCCQWASINPLGKGAWGQRTWVGLGGGHWSALWGKGTIVVCIPSWDLFLM